MDAMVVASSYKGCAAVRCECGLEGVVPRHAALVGVALRPHRCQSVLRPSTRSVGSQVASVRPRVVTILGP